MNVLVRAVMLVGALGWLGACAYDQSMSQGQAKQKQQVQTIMDQVRAVILQSSPGW
jgi:hypothetical protein